MIITTSRRYALMGTAAAVALGVVGAATISSGEAIASNSVPSASSVSATVVAPAVAAPTAAEVRAETIRKYGVHPLPVSVRSIDQYQLGKKALKEIVAAQKLAGTAKAKRIRKCESGGNYKINTGNGYYGAYQFDRGTWLSNGGGRYARTANRAPRFAQDHIMYKTFKSRGWSPWACQ